MVKNFGREPPRRGSGFCTCLDPGTCTGCTLVILEPLLSTPKEGLTLQLVGLDSSWAGGSRELGEKRCGPGFRQGGYRIGGSVHPLPLPQQNDYCDGPVKTTPTPILRSAALPGARNLPLCPLGCGMRPWGLFGTIRSSSCKTPCSKHTRRMFC